MVSPDSKMLIPGRISWKDDTWNIFLKVDPEADTWKAWAWDLLKLESVYLRKEAFMHDSFLFTYRRYITYDHRK